MTPSKFGQSLEGAFARELREQLASPSQRLDESAFGFVEELVERNSSQAGGEPVMLTAPWAIRRLALVVRERTLEKIREPRNAIVHVNSPEFSFSLRKAANALNWCHRGVGGLLILLEGIAHRWPAPKVWAVRFAPSVSFGPKPR